MQFFFIFVSDISNTASLYYTVNAYVFVLNVSSDVNKYVANYTHMDMILYLKSL